MLTGTDNTISRNYIRNYLFLVKEYEQIKLKKHPRYQFAVDFYSAHGLSKSRFLKFYRRYKECRDPASLLPRRRGPKWKTRRPIPYIENKVVALRQRGLNKFEISNILRPQLKQFTPSPSGIYTIIKRHNLNRLKPKMKEEKRMIIKEKAGELGHFDSHHLPRNILVENDRKLFLVAVIDDCSRIAWAEVVEDLKSLTVMFTGLKCLNMIADEYKIKFAEVLTDNGPEYGVKRSSKKEEHPFERMLMELGIKHRYTKPYRPQTNGKIERFWKTLHEDLIEGSMFQSLEEFKDELLQYIVYYNHERPHQALDGLTPVAFLEKCPRIT